jgi:MoaA/NifB/PqqE/SkfB family radical SAM enzyme
MIDPASAMRIVWHAIRSADYPLLAHLVVTRRCNLSCIYCNEYDSSSLPVPLASLKTRVRRLADLKTLMVACTGGEPLLHPDIGAVIYEIRRNGMVAMITTNGYALTEALIETLNEAGLQALQVSIDNVEPDDASAKSLRVLESRLQLLAERARFKVNINSGLGASEASAADVVAIAERARCLGFSHSVGFRHDAHGAIHPLSPCQRLAYHQLSKVSNAFLHRFNRWVFQGNVINGNPAAWKCRAGARYLYVCEHGLVHWCSQRRGVPAIPIERYGVADIRAGFRTRKSCSPFCTVTCVRQVSVFDRWRGRQKLPDTGTPGRRVEQARPWSRPRRLRSATAGKERQE